MYRRVECRPSGYPRPQVNHRSRRQAADARSRPEARPLASRFGASNPLSVFTEVAAFLVHGSGRRPKASSNSPTRRFAAHALHALLVGAALLLRAVRGFLGPTTIPYSTTNARSGRYIQMDVCTHTPRARDACTPGCKGRLAWRTPCATSSGPVGGLCQCGAEWGRMQRSRLLGSMHAGCMQCLLLSGSFCGNRLPTNGPALHCMLSFGTHQCPDVRSSLLCT